MTPVMTRYVIKLPCLFDTKLLIFVCPDSVLVISSPHTTFSPHKQSIKPLLRSFILPNSKAPSKCIKWAPLLPAHPTPSTVLLPTEFDQAQHEFPPCKIPLFAASTGLWGEFLSNYHLFTLLYFEFLIFSKKWTSVQNAQR